MKILIENGRVIDPASGWSVTACPSTPPAISDNGAVASCASRGGVRHAVLVVPAGL